MSAINTQTDKNLNIDFSHRLTGFSVDTLNVNSLADSIESMTERATGVLHLLSCQFESDNGSRVVSDALVCAAINAVIQEIADIKAVTDAYARTECAKHQA